MERNRTTYVILGILSIEGGKSGYEIRKAIESTVGYFWSESYGQIYPTLKRMAAKGLIEPSAPATAEKKRRQAYRLTEAGRECLREWLALPFQNDPPRNEFLLKLFFAREAQPGVALKHVLELNERNRQGLALLEGLEKMVEGQAAQHPHSQYWMLTMGLGAAMTRAALEWGERAAAELGREKGTVASGLKASRSY